MIQTTTRNEIRLTRALVTRLPSPFGIWAALAIGFLRWAVSR